MIKVIQVCTDTNYGGAGTVLLNYLKYYNKETVDIKTILPKKSILIDKIYNLQRDEKIIELDYIADKSFSLKGVYEFLKIFKKEKPDIVHAHSCLSARIACKVLGIKIVYTKHWLDDSSKQYKFYTKFLNNFLCDKAIAVSKATALSIEKMGVDKEKISVVYNGCRDMHIYSDDEIKDFKASLGVENQQIVSNISRLEDVKDIKTFINCAKKVTEQKDNVLFIIAGKGSLEQELKEYTKSQSIEHKLKFIGFVENVDLLYNATDITVVSSKAEAFSMTVLESMSLGIPVVATTCGGPEELITNEKNGYLVGVGDYKDMANKVLHILNDKNLAENLGVTGKTIAQQKFTGKIMSEQIDNIYMSM